MTVLVLTGDTDPTVDPVIGFLTDRGVTVVRADTGWFPLRMGPDARTVGGYWRGELHAGERVVTLEDLRSVWYRQPTAFTFPGDMAPAERRHAALEAKIGLGGVLWGLPGCCGSTTPAGRPTCTNPRSWPWPPRAD